MFLQTYIVPDLYWFFKKALYELKPCDLQFSSNEQKVKTKI